MNRREKRAAIHKNKRQGGVTQFRQRLFDSKAGNPKKLFRELHAFRDYREMAAVARYVSSPTNPFHQLIFGIPFAKSYDRVRSNHFSVFTDNIQRDLDWMSLSVVQYSKEITDFVKKSSAFQKSFLLGSYEEASTILETIKTSFGLSLWVLEKTFLLLEYASGLENNKKFLTKIIGDKQNDAILNFIAEYLSLRCEVKLSEENYKLRLSRGLDFDGDFSQLKNYFRYRLQTVGMDLISVASHITYFEGASPIIDRYLTFIAILQECAVNTAGLSSVAANIVQRLDGVVKDHLSGPLCQDNKGVRLRW